MTCREDGSIVERSHAEYLGLALGGHLQFVADGGCGQLVGLLFLTRAIDGTQRLTVEPLLADDAVVVG